MDYKERLRAFNSTDKYNSEMIFLSYLNPLGICLDYGCGIGTFMDEYVVDGYDVNNYYEGSYKENYYNELPDNEYENITFLHSLAHIPNPKEVLIDLKKRYDATITVITPNASWLALQTNQGYTPDPTVIKHYTQKELKELFESAGYEVTLIGQFGESMNGINERIFLQAI